MPVVKILEADLSKLALAKAGTSVIKLKPLPVVVNIEVDAKVQKAIEDDPLLHQQMADKAKKKLDAFAVELGALIKETAEKIIKQPGDKQLLEDIAEKDFEQIAKMAEKQLPLEVMKTWEKLKARKAEYKAYKIKAGIKIATGAVSIAASVATTAVGGFSGAGAVLGLLGLMKSVQTFGQEIAKLAKDMPSTMKALEEMVMKVAARYKDETSNGKIGVMELGEAVLAQLNGYKRDSIAKCVEWEKLLGSKLAGVEVNAHSIAKNVNKMLIDLQKAQTELPKYLDKLKPNLPSADVVKVMGQAGKVEKDIRAMFVKCQDLITKCQKTATEASNGRKSHKMLADKVACLNEKVPNWSKVLSKATPLLDFATCTDWGDAVASAAQIISEGVQETEAFDKLIAKVCK